MQGCCDNTLGYTVPRAFGSCTMVNFTLWLTSDSLSSVLLLPRSLFAATRHNQQELAILSYNNLGAALYIQAMVASARGRTARVKVRARG